jgi:hypothetical protein
MTDSDIASDTERHGSTDIRLKNVDPSKNIKKIDLKQNKMFKPPRLRFFAPKASIIPEVLYENDKDNSYEDFGLTQEKFDDEIDLIHKYLTFEFKTNAFSSKLIIDAFANQGWFKLIASLHNLTRCHLLWLSRNFSHISNDERLLSKVSVVNKIENLDALFQPDIFKENLKIFLGWYNTIIVSLFLINL